LEMGETPCRHMDLIFTHVPDLEFATGLELGAGDGYQTTLLKRYVADLTCTDLDTSHIQDREEGVTYRVCDAQSVERCFAEATFDLVFSSSVMEHVQDSIAAWRGINAVLNPDGLVICLMPTPFWRIACSAGFYLLLPTQLIRGIVARISPRGRGSAEVDAPVGITKRPPRLRGWLGRLFIPGPHGVDRSSLAELVSFGRSRWRHEMMVAGFDVVRIKKGPVSSGYGFRIVWLTRLLESLGFAGSFIYILKKQGSVSTHERHFL
jgi:SAM-dependent methyltransferase